LFVFYISNNQTQCKGKMFACLIDLRYLRLMEKKMFSTRMNLDLLKRAKKLAVDLERPLNDLLEEAIQDLLKKYEANAKR